MREKRYRNQLLSKIEASRHEGNAAMLQEFADLSGKSSAHRMAPSAAKAVGIETPEARHRVRKELNKLHEEAVFDRGRPVGERLKSLRHVAAHLAENKDATLGLIRLMASAGEPQSLRIGAHDAVKAAAFFSRTADAWRPNFLKALRTIAQKESGHIVSVALHSLAQYKDDWALAQLEDGLRNPKVAKVKPLRAVQFLAYDDHASHFDVLRDLAAKNRSSKVRIAAIHSLAADPNASGVLENVLKNGNESSEVRRAAMMSLRQANPSSYAKEVERIVGDEGEDSALRAAGITALAVGGDNKLRSQIDKVYSGTKSDLVRSAAKTYLQLD